ISKDAFAPKVETPRESSKQMMSRLKAEQDGRRLAAAEQARLAEEAAGPAPPVNPAQVALDQGQRYLRKHPRAAKTLKQEAKRVAAQHEAEAKAAAEKAAIDNDPAVIVCREN